MALRHVPHWVRASLIIGAIIVAVGGYVAYRAGAFAVLTSRFWAAETDPYGEACVPIDTSQPAKPVALGIQCRATSNMITWGDIQAAFSRENIVERSIDGGPFKRIYAEAFNCRWAHGNGYLDTDIEPGHTYAYRHRTAPEVYSPAVTCPGGTPTPAPEANVWGCPKNTRAICGLQYEELRKKGIRSLCGANCCDTAYSLRFGHAGYDPASKLFWNLAGGSRWEDHTTWAWNTTPQLTDLQSWCGGDASQFQTKYVKAPPERPSIDAMQIRCFYAFELYMQGKATWYDVTGGINYDDYPLCNRCPRGGCEAAGVTPLPLTYLWRTDVPATPTPSVQPTASSTPGPSGTPSVGTKLTVNGVTTASVRQLEKFSFVATGLSPGAQVTRWAQQFGTAQPQRLQPTLTAGLDGTLRWDYMPGCVGTTGTWLLWATDANGRRTNTVRETVTANPVCATTRPTPGQFGLREGDLISAEGDRDIFIINANGFKRLFLNEVIFGFYGHLGGFGAVRRVTPAVRDAFETSPLYTNCETNDRQVWVLEVTGDDTGTFHRAAFWDTLGRWNDPSYAQRVFCINSSEQRWYPKGTTYTDPQQVR